MANRTRIHGMRGPVGRFLNPLSRRVAGRLPGFGIVIHRGRRSGRRYETPINVFHRDGSWVFVLTYGSDVDWVKNVVAAAGCTLRTRGRDIPLEEPTLVVDPSLPGMPLPVRIMGRLIRATELLVLRPAAAGPTGPSDGDGR